MAQAKLQNYLRAYRRRLGLSQEEVSFLLGSRSGGKVSQYERFSRVPTLRTAIRLEVLFDAPIRDLFAGEFEYAEKEALKRARFLVRRLERRCCDPQQTRKLAALRDLTRRPPEELSYEPIDDLGL